MTYVSNGGAAHGVPSGNQSEPPHVAAVELTLRQVCEWASKQARRLADGYGLTEQDRDLFLLRTLQRRLAGRGISRRHYLRGHPVRTARRRPEPGHRGEDRQA
jgi:hypothetical protein